MPYQLVKRELDVRPSATTVEVCYKGQRGASHPRSYQPGRYTTAAPHMPQAHQAYAHWTP